MTRVVFLIPTPLRSYADGRSRIEVEVGKEPPALGDALEALWDVAPGVRDRVLTEQGEVRPHVNVFVGTESCRWTGGLATPIAGGAEIAIFPAISGGRASEGDDMRYMLLMYRDETVWEARSEEERGAIRQQAIDFSEGFRERGVFQGGNPLLPTSTATTVRLSKGKIATTDGPFAETKEQLGGYTILETGDLDEALAFAARHPLVLVGGHSIEIRPIRELGPPR